MHPALASAPASFWYRCAVEQEPGKEREVDTDTSGERVPSPDARVDVKHLELTVPRVSLELHLDQPGEAHGRQETSGGLDDSWLTFADLLHLSDAALRAVFAAADSDVALLALTGAEPRLIARILRKIPARDAALLRQRLEHPGPLRIRDVEQAQAALAAIATRLAHEGTITLPSSIRFAAAV